MKATRVVVNIDPTIDLKCDGCGRITTKDEKSCCGIYDQPKAQWSRLMGCAARTHNKVAQVEDTFKLNPLKASKRGIRQ